MKYRFQRENTLEDNDNEVNTMVGICHDGNKPLGQSVVYNLICKQIANNIFFCIILIVQGSSLDTH